MIQLTVQLVLMPLPWSIRRRCLNALFGWRIDREARVRWAIVLSKAVTMAPLSRIGAFSFVRVDILDMERDAGIGPWNYVTGMSTANLSHFLEPRACHLTMRQGAGITSRHFLDCTYGIEIGKFSTIAGIRSTILTHSIDVVENRQRGAGVKIGAYNFVGAHCVMLPGLTTGDYLVFGAASLLRGDIGGGPGLYAGNPAVFIKAYSMEHTRYFHRVSGNVA